MAMKNSLHKGGISGIPQVQTRVQTNQALEGGEDDIEVVIEDDPLEEDMGMNEAVQAGGYVPWHAPMKARTIVQEHQCDPCCESVRHIMVSNTPLPPPLDKINIGPHIVEGVLRLDWGDAGVPVILLPKSLHAQVIQRHHRAMRGIWVCLRQCSTSGSATGGLECVRV